MKIDIKKCMELGIDPNSMTLLTAIKKADSEFYDWFKEECKVNDGSINIYLLDLRNWGYIQLPPTFPYHTFEELVALNKGKKVKDKSDPEFDKFVSEWYALWPFEVKTMGHSVRSGEAGCSSKLKSFFKRTKGKYTKEAVMIATKAYLNYFKQRDYQGIQTAQYFIEKNRSSALESTCEAYLAGKLQDGSVKSNETRL